MAAGAIGGRETLNRFPLRGRARRASRMAAMCAGQSSHCMPTRRCSGHMPKRPAPSRPARLHLQRPPRKIPSLPSFTHYTASRRLIPCRSTHLTARLSLTSSPPPPSPCLPLLHILAAHPRPSRAGRPVPASSSNSLPASPRHSNLPPDNSPIARRPLGAGPSRIGIPISLLAPLASATAAYLTVPA